MSIHAQLSPEALENLRRQQRSSTISSIVAAMLVVVMIALFLGIFLLPNIQKDTSTLTALPTYKETIAEPPAKPSKQLIKQKPSPPIHEKRVIVSNSTSSIAIPMIVADTPTLSIESSDDMDFGKDWLQGDDFSKIRTFESVPSIMRQRCSKQDRLKLLNDSGGTEECEKAVLKSLKWLKETQNPDGSWTHDYPIAMTGLAILSYLGHCELPTQSKEYGDTVLKGITYLINIGLQNEGTLSKKGAVGNPWVYEHGIATYALAEATTFCEKLNIDIPNLKKVTKQAGERIMSGQGAKGGWVYGFRPTEHGDNSIGFWQIQALKACKHTGIWPKSHFTSYSKKALSLLESVQGDNGAIGYNRNPNQSPGLTAGGVLAFQMWGKGNSSSAKKGIDFISKHSEFEWNTSNGNLYYHYYNVQAMINYGGQKWNQYNERFRDELLKNQNKDGSWSMRKISHGPINDHMTTCLATFMLEAYYRFLPSADIE